MHDIDNSEGFFIPSPIYILILVIASVFVGTAASFFIPCPPSYNDFGWRLLIGAIILAVLNRISALIDLIKRKYINRLIQNGMSALSNSHLAMVYHGFGVMSPLDFCYVMMMTNYYIKETEGQTGNGTILYQYLHNPDLHEKEVSVFQTMFDRKPMQSKYCSWVYSAICETAEKTGIPANMISYEDITQNVNRSILRNFEDMNPAWTKLVREDIEAGDPRIEC